MYLKTLTVRGFKSFASATTFDFEPGVTAVVGPNGSGKSNVVDALAWVMGEQGAKTLRGGKMEDVIFAGTSARPALGRAQVTLTIDNSDGALPIEYSEVTISRTLFRSGGSEYAVNGSPCRLLDIQELLSDSGLGREMHVIVGQGQLDRILRATAEERRGFIEEAAGILKHRRRKEKTLRKLDAMQANLARLEDLTGEIAKQLKPLGRQADTARRARTVQATLRDARSRLLADDLCALQTDARAAEEERAEIDAAIAQAQSTVEAASTELIAVERSAADAAPVAVRARETWYALTRLQERYRALINLASERRRLLGTSDDAHRGGDDPDELEARAGRLETEAEDAHRITEDLRLALDAAHTARVDAESAQRAEDERLTAVLRAVADRREGLARLAGDVGTARQRLESAQGERARAQEAGEAARQRAAAADHDLVQARSLADEAARAAAGPTTAVVEAREKAQIARESLRAARAEVAPLAEARAGLEARVETLGESLPHDLGTGTLLEGVTDRLLGVLAERLRVAPGAEAAVGAALMGAQAALVAVDEGALEQVALAAAEGEEGSVWLLNRLGPSDITRSLELPDGAAWLADSVECDDEDRDVVSGLLAGVVLAKDDVQAQGLVMDHHLVAVTRHGHRWDGHGLRIGAGDITALARRARLESAQEELTSARGAEERARNEFARLEPLAAVAQERVRSAEEEARAATDRSRKAAAEVSRLESLSRQATAEAERAETAADRTASAVSQARADLEDLNRRLDNAQALPAEEEPSTEERDRLAKLAESARAAEMQARMDLRAAEEANQRLTERISGLKRAAARERQARFQAELRARRRAAQAQRAERVAGLATYVDRQLATAVEAAQRALNSAESRQRRLAAQLEVARGTLSRAKEEVVRLNDSAHAGEVLAAERAARLQNLHERILEEVGMTPEYLVEHFGPHLPVPSEDDPNDRWAALRVEVDDEGRPISGVPFDRAEQEKRLKRAEKDLSALGKINPLALEEFAALEERHTYLTGQLDDLRSSRADLLDLVRQVDEHVREVFAAAYADTAVEFKRIFSRLFPGGEGELVLTEPEDMLATGIEVHARPAGKKVKRLSLLSGGERSLTAIAMLVAIFTARPSPFYVMDEVEAALDERNLLRLLGVFSDLREHSQLIIITHQKHTMDIADALYGVSMRGDGITQVISQVIDREQDPASGT